MKHILLLLALLAFQNTQSQTSAIVNAYSCYSQQKYAEAKEWIDQATENESTSDNAKTWYYRGLIYLEITQHLQSASPFDYGINAGDAAAIAAQSFQKALSYENPRFDVKEARSKYMFCSNLLFLEGIEAYNDADYLKAATLFRETTVVQENNGLTDSLASYNTALSYDNLGMAHEAIKWYAKCIEIDYQQLNSTLSKATLELSLDDAASAVGTLDAGLLQFPYETSLIRMKIGILDAMGRKEAAVTLADEAMQHNDDATLHFVKGQLIQKEKPQEAIKQYELALHKQPEYYEALYNVGALYFNSALDRLEQNANAQVADLFEKALKNLETLNELAPGDETVEYYIQVIKERLQ